MFDLSLPQREVAPQDQLFHSFLAADSLPIVPSLKAIGAGILGEIVAAILCRRWPLVAVILLGTGAACLAWPTLRRIRFIASLRRAWVPTAFTLAFLLSAIFIYFRLGGGGDEPVQSKSSSGRDHRETATEGLNGIYDGVILLTDVAPQKLVVPPKLRPSRDPSPAKVSTPLSIPFFGVYWMFKWPRSQPPPGSYTLKKSPLEGVFRSSDRGPLLMQARQNFGRFIDLSCCSKIQIAIRTEDPVATLELIVTDTIAPGAPSLSLGQVTIHSKSLAPEQMLLSFDVPRSPAIRQFDEIAIIFNRAYASASAKIAIDRFIFVPRGL